MLLTRDERLNDVIPHWTDPLKIEEGPNEKEYWKIADMYDKYVNRKINIRSACKKYCVIDFILVWHNLNT